jgi:hypothetical protein
MLFVLVGVAALAVDVGFQYARKAAVQILADAAAIEALASVNPALTYAEEDVAIRRFVANISEANGLARDLFRVKTYGCDSSGGSAGWGTTDHGHVSDDPSEHIDKGDGTTHLDHSGRRVPSRHSRLPRPGGAPAGELLAAWARPGVRDALPLLGAPGLRVTMRLAGPELPVWMRPGAINLADAHGGGGATGHYGYGVPSVIPPPTPGDVCRVEVSTTLDSPSFFASILRFANFRLGIYAAAQRNYLVSTTSRNCAFWASQSFSVRGVSKNCIDSYDSTLGDYFTQLAACGAACDIPGVHGNNCTRYLGAESGLCSDGTLSLSGNLTQMSDLSVLGNVSISGNSYDVYGDVVTGGSFSGDAGNIHGTLIEGAPVTALTVPPVSFSLPPSYPDVRLVNDNSTTNITGYVQTAALSSYTLTDESGSAPNPGCDPLAPSDRKAICLTAGKVYYFRSISIGSNSNLRLVGSSTNPTIIYLDNYSSSSSFAFNGGVFNTSGEPGKLLIRGASSTGRLDGVLGLTGNSSIHADIMAPGYTVNLTGGGGSEDGDLFGRIFAKAIDVRGNQSLHFDESLAPVDVGVTTSVSTLSKVVLVE